MSTDKRLAFVGLGKMGAAMAHRLLDSQYRLTVFNRTSVKSGDLAARGADCAPSAAAAVEGHDVVVLSLADDKAVESVLFEQMLPALRSGVTVIDTSTVSPSYAVQSARRLADIGVRRVESVVVGNPLQARAGKLRIFTAGPAIDDTEIRDVLDFLGTEITHIGDSGNAAKLKLVFNLVLGGQIAALAEAVQFGTAAGLDRDELLRIVAGSGFSSQVMKFRSELMLRYSYSPAFFRAILMEKDLCLALGSDEAAALELPVLDAVRNAFARVVAAGDGDKDAAVIIEHAVSKYL
ncbi:NAD(P)-dependent oxidoreductase [Nocardia salmonicida]|uniref:NAD(P)-dependent oxidoreductase n=1 Tax=Nocardia salmonicida TaxID=53431 RepID=UPI003CE9097B